MTKKKNKIIYFVIPTIVVFAISFFVLNFLGLVPKALKVDLIITDKDLPVNVNLPQGITKPNRIIIEKVGINSIIVEPPTVNVSILDEFLKKGAVYYPGSGTIEQGNIFIFGHSTNWPIVQNQAYKTFNGLEKLEKGDEIILEGQNGQSFVYIVENLVLADAEDVLVDFDNENRKLTISTCNTFGQKQERWVVTAYYQKTL